MTYAVFAGGMKRMLVQLADLPPATLRTAGLVATIVGMVLLLAARLIFGPA